MYYSLGRYINKVTKIDAYIDYIDLLQDLINYTDNLSINERIDQYLLELVQGLEEYLPMGAIAERVNDWIKEELLNENC